MPTPRIFVSSTCYDLAVVRSELRSFIVALGYEPHMSDYSDLLFDPHQHTHTSCVQEIAGCDLLILIIGRRFGGNALPKAVELVDFEELKGVSSSTELLKEKGNLSITQLEVIKAIQANVPVFAFVDNGVLNDHHTYERNKDKDILSKIIFPNIEKQDSAKYIFEFINFIRHRTIGNSLIGFSHLDEIREHLKKQWAALFQRLLYEQRFQREETKRIDYVSGQIADIKAALFASLSSSQLKNTAKGAVAYRRLIAFIIGIAQDGENVSQILRKKITWDELLKEFKVDKIFSEIGEQSTELRGWTIMLRNDGTYFRVRGPSRFLNDLQRQWVQFCDVDSTTRDAIIDALLENEGGRRGLGYVRYYAEQYEEPKQNLFGKGLEGLLENVGSGDSFE